VTFFFFLDAYDMAPFNSQMARRRHLQQPCLAEKGFATIHFIALKDLTMSIVLLRSFMFS